MVADLTVHLLLNYERGFSSSRSSDACLIFPGGSTPLPSSSHIYSLSPLTLQKHHFHTKRPLPLTEPQQSRAQAFSATETGVTVTLSPRLQMRMASFTWLGWPPPCQPPFPVCRAHLGLGIGFGFVLEQIFGHFCMPCSGCHVQWGFYFLQNNNITQSLTHAGVAKGTCRTQIAAWAQ